MSDAVKPPSLEDTPMNENERDLGQNTQGESENTFAAQADGETQATDTIVGGDATGDGGIQNDPAE